MKHLYLVLDNIRSAHNVGSIWRTADGLGVTKLYLIGVTPYPEVANDTRPPFVRRDATKKIHKTALGAENTIPFTYASTIEEILPELQKLQAELWALEQTPDSVSLQEFSPPLSMALILGQEVDGVPSSTLRHCAGALEIPMHGQKESFNVSVAAAIAAYHLLNGDFANPLD